MKVFNEHLLLTSIPKGSYTNGKDHLVGLSSVEWKVKISSRFYVYFVRAHTWIINKVDLFRIEYDFKSYSLPYQIKKSLISLFVAQYLQKVRIHEQ